MIEQFSFTLTKDDLIESHWKEAIDETEQKVLDFYFERLSEKARNETRNETKVVLQLLARISCYPIDTDNLQDPIPNVDQFSDEDLYFMSNIVNEIDDAELQSRIADILWIKNRNYKMAELAISSYIAASKEIENIEEGYYLVSRIERASQLASMLHNKILYQETLDRIFEILDDSDGENSIFLSFELMRLLLERKEGKPKEYSQICENLAVTAETKKDFNQARQFWDHKVRWHLQDNDEESARKTRIKIAESYEEESNFNFETRQPKYLMACDPLEKAIIAYRKAGNSNEKIDELKLKLREYQSQAVKELPTISSGGVDITDLFIHSENAVKNKSFFDSLKTLAFELSPPNQVGHIRKQVEEHRKKYILSTFFPKKLFSSNGRIVANQPSQGEEAILVDMFQYIAQSYQLRVMAFIEPARNIIILEHPSRVIEFYGMLLNHPFIPEDREIIVARGLHAGLTGDFLTATHLLIPQIEESIRYFLIRCGIVPNSFTDKGIQDEYNLNKLLKDEKFTEKLNEIFGEDFIFDLRCVLVERFGANLRNDMAHGLMEHNLFYSHATVYFWWLALRFYFAPVILNKETKNETKQENISSEN